MQRKPEENHGITAVRKHNLRRKDRVHLIGLKTESLGSALRLDWGHRTSSPRTGRDFVNRNQMPHPMLAPQRNA